MQALQLDFKSSTLPLFVFLFLGFIGDLIIAFFPSLLGINLVLRGIGIVPIVALTFREVKGIRIYLVLALGIILFVFNYFTYWILVPHNQMELSYFFTTLIWALKNYGLIIFFLYYSLVIQKGEEQKRALRILVIFSFVYMIFQLAGPLLHIETFMTYVKEGYRSGYKGIIYAQNEASAFYFFSGIIIVKYLRNKNKYIQYFVLLLLILTLIILGTKAGLLLLPILIFYYFYTRLGWRKSVLLLFLVLLLIAGLFLYFYHSNNAFKSAVDLTVSYYKYRLDKGMDLITVFTSGRNHLLQKIYARTFEHMPTAILYGGTPISYRTIEMDFFDQVLVFGLPFTIWFYSVVYFYFGGKNNRLLFSVFFLLSLIAGHVTYSIITAPFLAGALYFKTKRNGPV